MNHSSMHGYITAYRLDGLLITNLLNVCYLTGFTGTNGFILITKKKQFFFTDSRYTEQAKREVDQVFQVRRVGQVVNDDIEKLLKQLKVKRLGFEAGTVSYGQFHRLKKGLRRITLVPIKEDPAEIRMIKSKDEIKKLEKALQINRLAFDEIHKYIKPGIRELDLAFKLEFALRKHGAEKLAFDTIVASGIRGALPHGKASKKKLKAGEFVTIDFGGVYQGYHADETATVLVGANGAITPSLALPLVGGGNERGSSGRFSPQQGGRQRGGFHHQPGIYQTVLIAQQLALEKIKPGVKCSDLDKVARDYITQKGYGKYFGHALGHGVGLEVHERPVLSPKSEDILLEGMVFTIEPGIYIPGWGGVRLEDVFVCEKNGSKRISKINK